MRALARLCASRAGTSRPVCPSITCSEAPPTSVAMTGSPAAMASRDAFGQPAGSDHSTAACLCSLPPPPSEGEGAGGGGPVRGPESRAVRRVGIAEPPLLGLAYRHTIGHHVYGRAQELRGPLGLSLVLHDHP